MSGDARGDGTLGRGAATGAVVGAAVAFSTISIATVIATRDGTPLSTVVLLRFLLAALTLLAASGWRALRVTRGHAARLVLQGGVGQVIVNLLNLSALAYIPAATTVFLFYTFPAWVAVLAAVRGTERVGPRRAAALLGSLVGIVVLVGAPGAASMHPVGAALSLGAAVVYAVYIPLLRRLQAGTTPSAALFWIAIGVVATLLAWGGARGELALPASARSAGAIGWLAVVPTLIAFRLFLRGLATLGPVRTAIISTTEPFCAALLAALLLGQPLTASTLAGGLLIAAAVIVLQRPEAADPP